MSPEKKRAMIKRDHPELSISQQCKLVRLSRSVFYDRPVGVDADTLAMMKEIDRVFTKYPFFGSRQSCQWLRHWSERPLATPICEEKARASGGTASGD